MKAKNSYKWWMLVSFTALLAVMVSAAVLANDSETPQDGLEIQQDGQESQLGGSDKYARWTANWWQWIYGIPASQNPAFDETGERAYTGQPKLPTFFLVGVFNESGEVSRSITLPRGTPLFGPIINSQWDNVGANRVDENNLTVRQMRANAAAFIDVATYYLEVDGKSRPDLVARIKSKVFSYVLPKKDNFYHHFGYGPNVFGRVTPAVSDGYWFYIHPLKPGKHTVDFGAKSGNFELEVEYDILVQ